MKIMPRTLAYVWVLCFTANAFAQDGLSQSDQAVRYQSAHELLLKRQFGGARQQFEEYRANAPAPDERTLAAIYYAGICALHLYHPDGERELDRFVKNHPQNALASTAYFEMANFFYQEKNFAKAAGYFEKSDFTVLSSEKQNTGRFRWGYCLFSLKKLKEANEQFNAVKAQGGQYGPAASYYAGFAEYQEGDYANALIDFKRAESAAAYAPVVPSLIGNVLYRQKKYDEVISYANTVSTREGVTNRDELALLVAESQYKKKDYRAAVLSYEKYLTGREGTTDKGVLLRAGHAAYQVGQSAQAISYLKQAALAPDSTGHYASYYLGALYVQSQQKPLALAAFDHARKFTKDQRLAGESNYAYAKLAYELGNADLAIAEMEKMLAAEPNGPRANELRELLSQAYVNANNYNKAIAYIESLPARNANVDRAYQKATLLKGMEYFNKEDYANAVASFEKSLQTPLDEEYAGEAAFWAGEAYAIGNKHEQAIKKYQQVIALSGFRNKSLQSRARYGLGYEYYYQKQYDKALLYFKEYTNSAPDTDPHKADGLLRVADCYYVSKNYADALAFYRKALQQRTADADYAHLQMGIIHGLLKNYPEGRRELDYVVKNYPQSSWVDEALFERGQLDFVLGNYASAAESYSIVIAQHPASPFVPYAHARRAASFFNLKEYGKTADDYIAMIKEYPTHPASKDVLLPLQEALSLANRSDEFEGYLARVKKVNPDSKGVEAVEFGVARNQFLNQEYSKALQSLASFLAGYPDSPNRTEAIYYQGESHYRLKNMDKALESYYQIENELTFEFATRVTARVAELEFKANRLEKALPAYQRLAKMASNKKDQYTAWSGLMETHFLLAAYDSSSAYAQLILAKGNVNAGAVNKASLFLGKNAMAKGDYELAKDEFINTLNSAQDEYGAEAKYLLGEIFFLTKDHKSCYETLVSLNRDFSSYTPWVGKSFLLLSENYLAMGDTFQARGALQSLVDNFPDPIVKNIARERLRKIEASEAAKRATPADTTQTPK